MIRCRGGTGSNRALAMAPLLLRLLLLLGLGLSPIALGAGVDARNWGTDEHHRKFSGVIIPGFMSTRLRSWSLLDCPFSPLNFNPLDPVWLDTRKVLSVPYCWMKCMVLDPVNQTDHPECKSRPDSGIAAISELDPGYITGPLSSVWKDWVAWCVEFGIEAESIVAAPYDWRLAGSALEARDLYFHRLRLTFETCRKLRGGPSLVFAHSLGNNVFRYFLEWLKQEIAPKDYLMWIDDHIFAYHALGAPFLGAAETVKGWLSGVTFGLPIAEGTARSMLSTFSSGLWMLPFSPSCVPSTKACCCTGRDSCNEDDAFSWPMDVLKIDVPMDAGFSLEVNPLPTLPECSLPFQRTYPAQKIADGTIFLENLDIDADGKSAFELLKKYYLDDPVLNPLTPWERPPIKNVYCIYGVNLKTEVGYHFAPTGRPFPDNWMMKDVFYETDGTLVSRSGVEVQGSPSAVTGDATVPYNSLSWCKTWLGEQVNVTRAPQTAHDGSDVQELFNVEPRPGGDIPVNVSRDNRMKYITYYEDALSIPGKKTAVWEVDKIDHRNLVRSPVLLRELWLEILHDSHPQATRSFVSKAKREPMRDEDCFWDYSKARCAMMQRCEYRYVFGDVHLGQSCRLKASTGTHILHYL
ncbi:phospholipid--sterol O-acyltransferase [Selaginella moellendorffii]|uniref:phospholipid--sterol O-acyltransferase n=1 Tax=Selaginella moellendorffii TaxID=88036 RepID=UPI000D1C73BB|nr:phospholipid--sterol O-acyltransferase [Selaginella moellendorffii]|eukprot:XP_024533140.1 phospholipid--sterol O-acyltransferase [Selaginella moellendorffii]